MPSEIANLQLQYIKGIGPKKAEVLFNEKIKNTIDLINYFPRTYIDRNATTSIKAIIIQLLSDNNQNSEALIENYIHKVEYNIVAKIANKALKQYSGKKKYLKITVQDDFGTNAEVIFWSYADYYNKIYEIGDLISISGKPELSPNNKISFSHPEVNKIEFDDNSKSDNTKHDKTKRENSIIPIYPSPESFKKSGITNKLIFEAIKSALELELDYIPETLPKYVLEDNSFPDIKTSIKSLHIPKSYEDIELSKNRFKFEEILYFELFLALKQAGIKLHEPGIVISPKSKLARKVFEDLNFKLTRDQIKVINEIANDMKSGRPMNRLLQGDVGSGKTIVAALSMLTVIEAGYQVALMAPTAILAEQHYNSFKKLLKDVDINITLLTGGAKNKKKLGKIEEINLGNAQIIIGTHSLFEDYVTFNNLGLVVIDEQHRFGVEQKAKTIKAAKMSNPEQISPHTLVMSATPIPRTLALTVYGDLDVSIIREMPANRLPIRTKVVFESQLESAYQFIRDEVQDGSQAYIVFPLVEKSDKLAELKSAVEYYDLLKDTEFAEIRCGLLHGQMTPAEKEMVMADFYAKKFDVLIATTVIEVGIDVPNATVMMIQDAHKFGLSQLHQLRGRVGRGSKQSYCILATKDNFQFEFKKKNKDDSELKANIFRLRTMERTTDGFEIAEADLKLRGPGDILGTKQSGLPDFKFIDLVRDGDIISKAKNDAFAIVKEDPTLSKFENAILKHNIKKLFSLADNYFNIA